MTARTHIPFMIMFEGRNGSSQLVSLLNAHPNILCYPEIAVSLDSEVQIELIKAVAGGRDLRPLTPYAADDTFYPQGFAKKWEAGAFQAVGFKTKVADLKNIVGAIDALENARYHVIYLKRSNPLKAVLSWINGRRIADKTNQWNARAPGDIDGPIQVNMDDFRNGLRHRQLLESLHRWFFDNYRGRKMTVAYEDMLADQAAFLGRVTGFLGSQCVASAFVGSFLKSTPDSLRKAVANYDDLEREYRNTEFARFLD
jgi:hypothetical protein